MPPKPVHIRTHSRDNIWEAIRARRKFTALDIEGESRCALGTIKTYLQALKKAGYIEIVEHIDICKHGANKPKKYKAAVYQLVRDSVEAPRVQRNGTEVTQGRPREQLWRTMRMIKEFSYDELALHASTEEHPVVRSNAKDYVQHLYRAGYLVRTRPGEPGRPAKYRLLPSMNTGPRPPQIQRIQQVYDANLKKVVWPTEAKQ